MKIYIKKSDVLFYAAYVLYYIAIFVTYLPIGANSMIKQCLALLTCICLILNLLPEIVQDFKFNKKKKILTLICIFVAVASTLLKDFFLIVVYLFAFNIYIKENDIKSLLKFSFYLLLSLMTITIFLCIVGVVENVTNYRNGHPRFSLGFYHSNVLPQILLYLCSYYHIFKKKITLLSFTVFEVLAVLVYIICDSRNIFFAMHGLLFLLILAKKFGNNKKYLKFLKILSLIAPLLIAGFALLLFYLYDKGSPIAKAFNDLFNNRIYMVSLYYHYQEFKIVNFMTTDYFKRIMLTLDNGYYYSTARYGVIFLLAIFAVFASLTKGAYKSNNSYYLSVIIILAAVNFIDNGFFSFLFYPFILEGIYYFKHRNNYEKCSAEYIIENMLKKH